MHPVTRTTPFLCFVLALAVSAPAHAANPPADFVDLAVIGGLDTPTNMSFLPDGRLLVTEQYTASVRLIVNGAFSATDPIATIPNVNTSGGERGLLGIAADPGWPARPYIYVYYDNLGTATNRLSRFTAAGDLSFTGNGDLTLDLGSRYDLVTNIPDNAFNHNGGSVRFGPDGMLYVGIGEDGNQCAAQNLSILGGKIVRLEIANVPPGPGGPGPFALITPSDNPFAASPDSNRRLVWAYGLRNPFSFHIDPVTGDLFIADVGAFSYEEVDQQTAGGQNFGWPFWEGPLRRTITCFGGVDTAAGFVAPIHWYQRTQPSASVIGGTIYRRPPGATTPFPAEYEGDVFFSDIYHDFLRRLKWSGSDWDLIPDPPDPLNWADGFSFVSDYQVGPDGALWYSGLGDGQIRRIVSTNPVSVSPGAPGDRVELSSPWPSPAAAGETQVSFWLERPRWLRLALYDLEGRLVRTLIPGEMRNAGPHVARWDGSTQDGLRVRAGVYLVRLTSDGTNLTRRLVWLR